MSDETQFNADTSHIQPPSARGEGQEGGAAASTHGEVHIETATNGTVIGVQHNHNTTDPAAIQAVVRASYAAARDEFDRRKSNSQAEKHTPVYVYVTITLLAILALTGLGMAVKWYHPRPPVPPSGGSTAQPHSQNNQSATAGAFVDVCEALPNASKIDGTEWNYQRSSDEPSSTNDWTLNHPLCFLWTKTLAQSDVGKRLYLRLVSTDKTHIVQASFLTDGNKQLYSSCERDFNKREWDMQVTPQNLQAQFEIWLDTPRGKPSLRETDGFPNDLEASYTLLSQ